MWASKAEGLNKGWVGYEFLDKVNKL